MHCTSPCPLYPQKRTCAVQLPMSAMGQKKTSQRKRLPQLAALSLFPHIPLICVETDEKALIFRLAIIFEVAAAYLLNRSVAKKASSAALLSQDSNNRTWFASFCETAILSWRRPGSFTVAAASSLI